MAIRILIADRQDMFREALKHLLEHEPGFSVVGDTGDGERLVRLVAKHKPDVLLLDLKLHKQNAIEALRQVSALKTGVRPIVLTDIIEKRDIVNILLCGARGVIRKGEPTGMLFKGIRSVMNGEYWVSREGICDLIQSLRSMSLMMARSDRVQTENLSRQERQIAEAIVSGYSNKEIAKELSVSERTVKYHATRIFSKYGVSGRMELVQHRLRHSFANFSQ